MLSLGIYLIQILIFHDAKNTLFYFMQDVAFLPIQVLLVTLVINKLLAYREKVNMLQKLNMVIGSFFTEVGVSLLKYFERFDSNVESIRKELMFDTNSGQDEFNRSLNKVGKYISHIDCHTDGLVRLKEFLIGKRNFMLGLLQNPNLLEHEAFTELLWAVFHLTEELSLRPDVTKLTNSDYEHLNVDIQRAYSILITQWLNYLNHLKEDYPYLYSFAVRTNPFRHR